MLYKVVVILAVLVIKGSHGETSLGKCTDVDPLVGFNIKKFLGLWYVIQTTDSPSNCLSYLFQNGEKEGHYKMVEIEQHSTIIPSILHHEHNVTGDLTVPDANKPATMNLDLPLDIGAWTFTVFLTDYDNYAAVFTCKKYPLFNRWSATILSRSRTIDMAFVDKVRVRLSSYNIDPFDLHIVSQNKCPKPGVQGSVVKTASNAVSSVRDGISNIVSKAGNAIVDLASDRTESDTERSADTDEELFKRRVTSINSDSNVGQRISGVIDNAEEKLSDAAVSARNYVSHNVNNLQEQTSKVVGQLRESVSSLSKVEE